MVPSSIMVALLKEAIVNGDKERFLIDGFPRSNDNMEAWFEAFTDEQVQVKKTKHPHAAINRRFLSYDFQIYRTPKT